MCIGLLGGSFDPPHGGHVHITREALRRFGLDRVWWLVSPGNPLKPRGPAPLAQRMAAARGIMTHPRVRVTDIEARLGTRYTAETLAALLPRHPGVRFVWLMGADNLETFHHWESWRRIMEQVPVGILARPDRQLPALRSPAARRYSRYRLPSREAARLCVAEAPAWCFVTMPMIDISSTEIREAGNWTGS